MNKILKVVFLQNHVIIIHDGEEETEYVLAKIIDEATDEKENQK